MHVRLTVHRSAHEIGGNCIEIAEEGGHRVILDVGRPLDAPEGAKNLLPRSLDLAAPCDGILISHPHQDHYGLLEETPTEWPVFCGEATEKLIRLTAGIFGTGIDRGFWYWKGKKSLQVGPFVVTPFLTDHSAFDAYMLLIEVHGRRIFYSGDFRTHGRKASLVQRLMASPPSKIDVLLMEGTNLGSDKPTVSETDLESDFVRLFRETQGRVFVAWSAQNIDRTVTLYRACLKTGRTLAVDLYTAEVLRLLEPYAKLPQPGWPGLKVVVTGALARMYRRKDREAFVQEMAAHGISARKLANDPARWAVMLRPSLITDFERNGVVPSGSDAWSWSMWSGYLKNEAGQRTSTWLNQGGARLVHAHTSGHASPRQLQAFANAIRPRCLVPIHGVAWDNAGNGFPPIRRLVDGEPLEI